MCFVASARDRAQQFVRARGAFGCPAGIQGTVGLTTRFCTFQEATTLPPRSTRSTPC